MDHRDRPSRTRPRAGSGVDSDRRAVAVAIAEADGPVSVDALATMLAAREHGRPAEHLGADERRRSRLALVRDHLPALVARDVLRRTDGGGYVPGPSIGPLLRGVDNEASRRE